MMETNQHIPEQTLTRIRMHLKTLKLTRMEKALDKELACAAKKSLPTSEVLEHLSDDRQAIKEIARVMKPSGHFIVTFPHRKFYFAIDDRFVGHFRRYEINEMIDRLKDAGFKPIAIQKVLGPLEKVTMSFAVLCYFIIQKFKSEKGKIPRNLVIVNIFSSIFKWANLYYAILAWLDARIMPRALSTVLLINSILSDKPEDKG